MAGNEKRTFLISDELTKILTSLFKGTLVIVSLIFKRGSWQVASVHTFSNPFTGCLPCGHHFCAAISGYVERYVE